MRVFSMSWCVVTYLYIYIFFIHSYNPNPNSKMITTTNKEHTPLSHSRFFSHAYRRFRVNREEIVVVLFLKKIFEREREKSKTYISYIYCSCIGSSIIIDI